MNRIRTSAALTVAFLGMINLATAGSPPVGVPSPPVIVPSPSPNAHPDVVPVGGGGGGTNITPVNTPEPSTMVIAGVSLAAASAYRLVRRRA